MYQRQEDHWGYVPNYATVFSHRPEVMGRWGKLLAEVRRPVDDCRFELVTFTVASLLKHTACSLAHGAKLAEILGMESVIAIADGRETEALSDENVSIVRFARDIARDASAITSKQVDVLRSAFGLSEAEIFDIAAIASARCFFTKILDALGSEPDAGLMQMNQELSQQLLG
jgi:alkylhydroperoxidase family enzyme